MKIDTIFGHGRELESTAAMADRARELEAGHSPDVLEQHMNIPHRAA